MFSAGKESFVGRAVFLAPAARAKLVKEVLAIATRVEKEWYEEFNFAQSMETMNLFLEINNLKKLNYETYTHSAFLSREYAGMLYSILYFVQALLLSVDRNLFSVYSKVKTSQPELNF